MKKIYTSPEVETRILDVLDVITYSEGGKDPAVKDDIDDYGPQSQELVP